MHTRNETATAGPISHRVSHEEDQHRGELASAHAELNKIETELPIVMARSEIRRKAAELQYGNQIAKLEAEQQVSELQSEREVLKHKIEPAEAAIAATQTQKLQIDAEFRKEAFNDYTRAVAQESAASEALMKSERRLALATIRSPIDGIIAQLNIRTVGGVITPAQQMMTIVPAGELPEVEAVLPSTDIGFVTTDQDVEIKVDAYPYTRYGLLKGKVLSVTEDADPKSNPNEPNPSGSQRRADQVDMIEGSDRLLYTVRIAITSEPFKINDKPVRLMSGMSVRSEIKTGRRRIIDFLLSPLTEYAGQSMRER